MRRMAKGDESPRKVEILASLPLTQRSVPVRSSQARPQARGHRFKSCTPLKAKAQAETEFVGHRFPVLHLSLTNHQDRTPPPPISKVRCGPDRRPFPDASATGDDRREASVATESIAVQAPARLVHLDRLKILLTAGVITAHAAMSYGAAGTWLYEEDSLSDATGLFFLMAGMLTTGPLQRRGPRRFLISRLVRLGIPVLAYALVVWPMLQWLKEQVQSEAPSPWAFYRREDRQL